MTRQSDSGGVAASDAPAGCASIFDGRAILIPFGTTAKDLQRAYVAAGWKYGSSTGERDPTVDELQEMLYDTHGQSWSCGGMHYRRGVGHFVHRNVWLHLPHVLGDRKQSIT